MCHNPLSTPLWSKTSELSHWKHSGTYNFNHELFYRDFEILLRIQQRNKCTLEPKWAQRLKIVPVFCVWNLTIIRFRELLPSRINKVTRLPETSALSVKIIICQPKKVPFSVFDWLRLAVKVSLRYSHAFPTQKCGFHAHKEVAALCSKLWYLKVTSTQIGDGKERGKESADGKEKMGEIFL